MIVGIEIDFCISIRMKIVRIKEVNEIGEKNGITTYNNFHKRKKKKKKIKKDKCAVAFRVIDTKVA